MDFHKRMEQSCLKVAAYARVSTDMEEQSNSFEAQRIYYTHYIEGKKNWRFVKVYADDGISGTSTKNRDGFNEMMEDAQKGKIDLILTKSISRFARNTVDSLMALRNLQKVDVDVYFEEQGIHSMDMAGEIMITVFSALAQEESRTMSENIKWGYRRRFEQMKPLISSKMIGYKRQENGVYSIVEEEAAAIVRKIYRLFMEGTTINGIRKILNEENPKETGSWCYNQVENILKNEKYTGNSRQLKTYKESIFGERKTNDGSQVSYYIENSHPAIVSKELYDQVQREFEKRREMVNLRLATGKGSLDQSHGFSGKYALSNVLVCGECGSPCRRQIWNIRGKRKAVWRCNRRLKEGKNSCPDSITLNETDLQRIIVEAINSVISNKQELRNEFEDHVKNSRKKTKDSVKEGDLESLYCSLDYKLYFYDDNLVSQLIKSIKVYQTKELKIEYKSGHIVMARLDKN